MDDDAKSVPDGGGGFLQVRRPNGDAGFTRAPLTCTWPARQAWAAPERVLVSRTAHSQRSTRTRSIRSPGRG